MPNPITHFEIVAKDAKKSQEFYKGVFGWQINANNPMNYGLVDTETGRGINGGVVGAGPGMSTGVTIYVEVDDLQAYLNKVQRLGGRTLVPPTVVPGMVTFALFADTDGNAVGLVKSEQAPT